ncbi:MAG TPA: polysaccharide biosynthesis tyrosine autokinase [Pyrinomonadaceae bacterium]|nr:polysaccharide biosynthesis tyrosine autokinase [Pyrinomonadaceae bacterium]
MEQDQRLTPLPRGAELQNTVGEYPASYNGFYEDESMSGRRSLRQYYNIVYKRLPLVIALVLVVTAAAAFYSFRQPSIYQASSELIVEPRSKPATAKDSININFGNEQNYTNTQLQLLQNPDLLKKVVVSLNLHHEANLPGTENRGIMATIRGIFSGEPAKSPNDQQLPVVNELTVVEGDQKQIQLSPEEDARATRYAAMLGGGLKVDQVDGTNLVTVTVQNQNPALAAKFADKVADIFIDENANREQEGTRNAYNELTKSIEELKQTIDQRQAEQIAQQQNSNLPLQDKGGELRATNLEALITQYNTARDETAKIQALYNAAISASGKGDIMSVVGDNKALQDARSQNLRRQAELEKRIEDIDRKIDERDQKRRELLATYTEEYSAVKKVDAELAELKGQRTRIANEVSNKIKAEGKKLEQDAEREVLASLRSQLSAAQQREERARINYAQASGEANIEGQAENRLVTIKREIETNRNLLDTYTQRSKELELALTSGKPNNIKVSNRAVVPQQPVGPQRMRNIIIAFLAAFAAGIGLAFLLDYLDDSVKTSEDVGRHLGLPTLALIPHQSLSKPNASNSLITTNGNGNGNGMSTSLVTLEERNSPMAEAYRHLRTSLLFSSAGKPPQTILVTSAQPSEGKTTTAMNTAITLAQGDADVIIIDCDLRRPRLHSHFGLTNTHGLTNYLSGERSTENLIKPLPGVPRLKVISSGPIPPNPAELLSSNEMRSLLQFLRGRYKHVVIDSPPALSFTDAAILSTLVDGVILVAMTGKSSLHLMRQFKTRLSHIGARIYGVVLNGVKSGSLDYDYYGSGYYDYYHKSGDDSTPMMEETAAVHTTKN